MRRAPLRHMPCSIAKALDVVGDPWTLLVLRDALLGVTRFDDFVRRLGIPRATLAARLDRLVDDRVLERRALAEEPGRHEYVLTELGRSTRPILITMMRWGDEWLREDAPPTTFEDLDTGEPIEPVLVDRRTGRPLDELRVRTVGEIVP